MPLYEGLALIQEKHPLVLELGSEYTRLGFAGEAAPRCIVRSEFWCAEQRRVRRVFEYRDYDQLYHNLVQFLHTLYFRHVLVNPKERRVVLVEDEVCESGVRGAVLRALVRAGAGGVAAVGRARAAAAVLGAGAGGGIALVVRGGARGVSVVAVLPDSPTHLLERRAGGGAGALRARLLELLREHDADLQLDRRQLEDIMVKACFVGSFSRGQQWRRHQEEGGAAPPEARGLHVPAGPGGATVWVSGRARELPAELLFIRDGEGASLGELVLQTVAAAPLDVRRPLLHNVVLSGGLSRLPGLLARLAGELRDLLPAHHALSALRARFHTPPVPAPSLCWLGAALLSAAAPPEVFTRGPRLPDWCDARDNTPPHHHHWAECAL